MYILRKREEGIVHDIGCYDSLERLVNAAAGHAKNRQEHGRLVPHYEVVETSEASEVCGLAVGTFSDLENCIVAFEEFTEIEKEICKKMRGYENEEHMADEIADVEIVLEKLKIRYGLHELVEKYRIQNVNELRKKIEGRAP